MESNITLSDNLPMETRLKRDSLTEGHILFTNFFRNSDILPVTEHMGIELTKYYSICFRLVVEHLYYKLSQNFSDCKLAVGLYGSAGRQEMAAHSDADVIIVTGSESKKEQKFRERFSEELVKFGYAKADIPNWGNVKMLSRISKTNIVEGNQILEAKIICGSPALIRSFRKMATNNTTIERSKRNLLFQWFCYDHYYSIRQKDGYINIKYSHGGTRDVMFFNWLARHEALVKNIPPVASISNSLQLLFESSRLSESQYQLLLNSISNVLLLRSEILKINRLGQFKGMSFIDSNMTTVKQSFILSLLVNKYGSDVFEKSMKNIARIKQSLMIDFIRRNFKDNSSFILASRKKTISYKAITRAINSNNYEQLIPIIWTQHIRLTATNIQEILNNNKKSPELWDLLASLISIPTLPEYLIDQVARITFSSPEYGYLLKMVAQHQNTSKATLRKIISSDVGERYKQLARIALRSTYREANFQI